MGNQPSNAISAPRPSTTLDSYVEELGKEVAYDKRYASCFWRTQFSVVETLTPVVRASLFQHRHRASPQDH